MGDENQQPSRASRLPVPAKRPDSGVTIARNLKRRSISVLNTPSAKRATIAPATSTAARGRTSSASNTIDRLSASQPLTGRATMAAGGPSYARPLGTRPAARTTTTGRTGTTSTLSRNTSTANATITRRATSPAAFSAAAQREANLKQELETAKTQMEALRSQLEASKSQVEAQKTILSMKEGALALKDQMLEAAKMEKEVLKGKLDIAQTEIESTQRKLVSLGQELDEKGKKLEESQTERRNLDLETRKLLNDVVDLKGQIRVAVRTRPILAKEDDTSTAHLSYPSATSIKLDLNGKPMSFEFQKVFGPNFGQRRIFDEVEELILSVLHGYNVSIIAFGQTGSGKTYTMRGELESEDCGIIPRATRCIFKNRDKMVDLGWEFEFTASYVEVYNEEIYDLLGGRRKCDVKMGSGSAVVEGINRKKISCGSEIESLLVTADRSRSVAATKCNEASSRSHAIFELKVDAKNSILGAECSSLLHLVDLAGSERAKDSGAEGDRFKEMKNINHGLTNLQMCIRSQLTKNTHIPYRNSKLTMLLMNSLGAGSSKTLVIVTLNPALTQAAETKRSLEFAREMSSVRIGAAVRQEK